MKKTTFLLFLSIGVSAHLCAQSPKPSAQESAQLLQEMQGHSKGRLQSKGSVSNYNGRDQEILARVNTPAIPADFPLYRKELTNEEYTALMNKWYDEHPALLKSKSNKQ